MSWQVANVAHEQGIRTQNYNICIRIMPQIIGFCSSVLIAELSFVCYLGPASLCFWSNTKFGGGHDKHRALCLGS